MENKVFIEIENFGPISYSKLDLNDLTFFIGPNNSGKSYAAMLIHLLLKLFEEIPSFRRFFYSHSNIQSDINFYIDDFVEDHKVKRRKFFEFDAGQLIESISGFLERNSETLDKLEVVEIPEELIERLHKNIIKSIKQFILQNLEDELKRIFACTLKELTKFGEECFKISIMSEEVDIIFECIDDKIISKKFKIKIPKIFISKKLLKRDQKYLLRIESVSFQVDDNVKVPKKMDFDKSAVAIFETLFPLLIIGLRKSLSLIDSKNFYYLPATRAGLIQGQKAISSAFYRLSSRALIEPINIPTLSGIISDFLVNIIEIRRKKGIYQELVEFIEINLTRGKIEYISDENGGASEIMYITTDGEIPLYRASSMISELAPIVLYFKHIIIRKCFLIIEEPEAHLHPDAQRFFAQFVVKLIRSGFKVLITTHSDFLILQINNFIRLTEKSKKFRREGIYDEDDFIDYREVNTFLFEYKDDFGGISTDKLETSIYGIKEDHFAKITDQLYGESSELDRK